MSHPTLPRRVAALVLVLSAPAAAQAPFEGVLTMRLRNETMGAMTARYFVNPAGARVEMAMPNGMEMVSIIDSKAREVYVVLPGQRSYMAMPVPDSAALTASVPKGKIEVRKLGTRETVAGHACENYLVAVDTLAMVSCVSTDLPTTTMPSIGLAQGASASPAAWASVPGTPKGMTLKVTPRGATAPLMEVVSIERKPLDAALFAVPAGYARMQLPAGMTPRP